MGAIDVLCVVYGGLLYWCSVLDILQLIVNLSSTLFIGYTNCTTLMGPEGYCEQPEIMKLIKPLYHIPQIKSHLSV